MCPRKLKAINLYSGVRLSSSFWDVRVELIVVLSHEECLEPRLGESKGTLISFGLARRLSLTEMNCPALEKLCQKLCLLSRTGPCLGMESFLLPYVILRGRYLDPKIFTFRLRM